MRSRSLVGLLTAVLGTPGLTAQSFVVFPVSATVQRDGHPPITTPIGSLRLAEADHGDRGRSLVTEFQFGFGLGGVIDDWHDIRHVYIERFRTEAGVPVRNSRAYGPLPAIFPPPRSRGGSDDQPYVNSWVVWDRGWRDGKTDTIREEYQTSEAGVFLNEPNLPNQPPPYKVTLDITVLTVAVRTSTDRLADGEMCVLSGAEYFYELDVDAAGKRTHTAKLGGQVSSVDGANLLNTALGNTSFPPRGKPWIALPGCVLRRCPNSKFAGVMPSRGVPEGHALLASSNMQAPASVGGLFLVSSVSGLVTPIQNVPDELTGKGTTTWNGAYRVAVIGEQADQCYVGEVLTPAPGNDMLDVHLLDLSGPRVVRGKKIASFGPYNGEPEHVAGMEVVPGSKDLIITIPRPKSDDASPIGRYDYAKDQFAPIPLTAPLPTGVPSALAVDPTASTIYLAVTDPGNNQTAVAAIPIEGGNPSLVVTLPRPIADLICHPFTGELHATGRVGRVLYLIDPFRRTFTTAATSTSSFAGGVWEEATGDMLAIDYIGLRLLRLTTAGSETVVAAPVLGSVGEMADIGLVPSPIRYGKARPGSFGADWDLPWNRTGRASSGRNDLPFAGNQDFGISASTNGWPLLGVIALGADRTPAPGIEIVDDLVLRGRLHLDPALMFAFIPVFGGSTARLPLPIPLGTDGFSLYAQGFFFDDSNVVYTPGLRTTIIRR